MLFKASNSHVDPFVEGRLVGGLFYFSYMI